MGGWAVPQSSRPNAEARPILVRVGIDSRGEQRLIRVEPDDAAETVRTSGNAAISTTDGNMTDSQGEASRLDFLGMIARWSSYTGKMMQRSPLEMTKASERPEPDP